MIVYSVIFLLFSFVQSDLVIQESTLSVLVGSNAAFNLELTAPLNEPVTVEVTLLETGVLTLNPNLIKVPEGDTGPWQVSVSGLERGNILVTAVVTPNITNYDKAYLRITVEYSEVLAVISTIIGWIYFSAWTFSFYPQIYENFVRKSVVGLNFDYLALNLLGFSLYAIFNCSLYWIHAIEDEYFRIHPRGHNPVQLNDIVFAIHAATATLFTIAQCLCYERGEQRVSRTVMFLLGAFFLMLAGTFCLAFFNYLTWLDFLYDCSYIKLVITLIKYIPQALMNYRRKSTVGWSIGNILLDLTGGTLSIGQMLINAYNFNDWVSIFGDLTKFGLGLFSVVFDILFVVQHYILYRHPSTEGSGLIQKP